MGIDSQSAGNGAEYRTDEDTSREQGRCTTTVDGIPHINNDTTADREGCACKDASEETTDEQRCEVVGKRLAEVEEHVSDQTYPEDDPAAEQLGTGSPEQRAEDITAKEDGGDEVANFGADAELSGDVGTCCRRRGRGKCSAGEQCQDVNPRVLEGIGLLTR